MHLYGEAPAGKWYRVVVHDREPTYEAATGGEREPFNFTWRVRAYGAELARKWAEREFWMMQSLSSVGWIREIVKFEVSECG